MAATQGRIEDFAGTGEAGNRNGAALQAAFASISGMVVDERTGALYVSTLRHTIRRILDGSVATVAGTGDQGSTDGPAPLATFRYPRGVAVDGEGNLFVADSYKIRKIGVDGNVTTFAGAGNLAENGRNTDGPPAVATFREPYGVAVNRKDGTVYVTDKGNHSIRRISANGHVTTVAGTGVAGYADGAGVGAQFADPEGIAVNENDGSVLVVDKGNNRIRKISADGTVTTLAGSADKEGKDGPATQASFYGPSNIVIDHHGSLFVDDKWWTVIRKIADGQVTTVAAHPTKTKPDGILQAAEFSRISSLALYNNILYVAEHNVIRKVTLL